MPRRKINYKSPEYSVWRKNGIKKMQKKYNTLVNHNFELMDELAGVKHTLVRRDNTIRRSNFIYTWFFVSSIILTVIICYTLFK